METMLWICYSGDCCGYDTVDCCGYVTVETVVDMLQWRLYCGYVSGNNTADMLQ
jgi:hypothetical protein